MSARAPQPPGNARALLPETDADTWRRFGLVDPGWIRRVLDDLRDARTAVTLHAPPDWRQFLVSRLLARERTVLRFDIVDDPQRAASLLDTGHLVAVAMLDRVKVQFDARAPRLERRDGATGLLCALPDRIVRIQRREAFRVRPPERHPVLCVMREAPGSERRYRVGDISADGIGLIVPGGEDAPAPGEIWRHCRLEIPGLPPIPCDLHVHTRTTLPRGGCRVGCGFHHPVPESQRAIQRYVMDVERGRVPVALPVRPACS